MNINKMRKIIKLSVISFTALFLMFLSAKVSAKNLANVIVDGKKIYESVTYEPLGSGIGLSLRSLAHIYNAFLEWKPVSSIATLYVNNKKIDIKVGDDDVYFDRKRRTLKEVARLIGNDIFVASDILETKEFADITQSDSLLDINNSILTITHHSNIAPVRYFTRAENTQLVLHLSEPLSYSVSKSTNSIILSIVGGVSKNERAQVGNGVVRDVIYENNGRATDIRINLLQTPKRVRVSRLSRPDRISVIIDHKSPIDITAAYNTDTLSYANINDDVSAFLSAPEELGKARIIKNPQSIGGQRSERAQDFISLFSKNDSPSNAVDYSIVQGENFKETLAPSLRKRNSNQKRIIVIDPGHGGHDPGAIGPAGTNEKDVTLAIAYELKKLLDEDGSYKAILTRSDDRFIPLGERAEIANKLHADLFISIHCNANINRSVDGFEIYFLSERATDPSAIATENLENSVLELEGKNDREKTTLQKMFWSMMLNEYINESAELSGFIAAETPRRLKIANRGVKQAGFYVLRGAEMPAVLVESAFISNYSQEMKLRTRAFQILVADSVYEGVIRYFARKDRQRK
jgi:N-acetylmuramoyl-L-alanine amidase